MGGGEGGEARSGSDADGGLKESKASGWPWWGAIERIVWPLLLCAAGGGEHTGLSDSEYQRTENE